MKHGMSRRPARIFRAIIGAALFAAVMVERPALGDDAGISVSGVGSAKGHASVVELSASVSGEGELAADANVKYRDTKKKVVAAFDALKNPSLSVESKGPVVSQALDPAAQMRMMQGQGGDTGKTRVQVSEDLRLVLKDADKLQPDKLLETIFKMIDTGRDSGAQIGPPPPANYFEMQMRAQGGGRNTLVVFKIPDITALQNAAYKEAVADARAKAERIADLSGVKLGQVIAVHDQGAPAASSGSANAYAMMMGMATSEAPDRLVPKEASSEAFGEIPVTVRLEVQFEIAR